MDLPNFHASSSVILHNHVLVCGVSIKGHTVKFRKQALGLIFFKDPLSGAYFWRGLSTEGNLCFKINWASLTVGSKSTFFALFFFVFEGNFPRTSPKGLIFGGAI